MMRRAAIYALALVLAFAAGRFGWQLGTMVHADIAKTHENHERSQ